MIIYDVIKKPLVTEKTATEKDAHNVVAFVVNKDANKIEIKQSVEKLSRLKLLLLKRSMSPARLSGPARTWASVPIGKRPM